MLTPAWYDLAHRTSEAGRGPRREDQCRKMLKEATVSTGQCLPVKLSKMWTRVLGATSLRHPSDMQWSAWSSSPKCEMHRPDEFLMRVICEGLPSLVPPFPLATSIGLDGLLLEILGSRG